MIELVKLKALSENVSFFLSKADVNYYESVGVNDLFSRYKNLKESLKENYPDVFSDIPQRSFYKPIKHEGRKMYIRNALEVLKNDIAYCIDVLEGMSTVDIPSMTVTREGIFFAGQFFDAIQRVSEILSNAQRSIALIDCYVDQKVLKLLTAKKKSVKVDILTKEVTPVLRTTALDFNKQYGGLSIRSSLAFHDRFIIIDNSEFYHFGASIKNLGNRGFMFSRIEEPIIINDLRLRYANEWTKAKSEV